MKSNFLKMDEFVRRHLLLSSFLLISFDGFFLNYYYQIIFLSSDFFNISSYNIKVDIIAFALCSIPVFIISLLMWSFLKNKDPVQIRQAFYHKLIICFIATFLSVPLYLGEFRDYSDLLGIFFAVVYGIAFSVFFAYFSYGSKKKIIVQCFIISILIGFLNRFRPLFFLSAYYMLKG